YALAVLAGLDPVVFIQEGIGQRPHHARHPVFVFLLLALSVALHVGIAEQSLQALLFGLLYVGRQRLVIQLDQPRHGAVVGLDVLLGFRLLGRLLAAAIHEAAVAIVLLRFLVHRF